MGSRRAIWELDEAWVGRVMSSCMAGLGSMASGGQGAASSRLCKLPSPELI